MRTLKIGTSILDVQKAINSGKQKGSQHGNVCA